MSSNYQLITYWAAEEQEEDGGGQQQPRQDVQQRVHAQVEAAAAHQHAAHPGGNTELGCSCDSVDSPSDDDGEQPVGLGGGERGDGDGEGEGHHGVGGGHAVLRVPARLQPHHRRHGRPRPAEEVLQGLSEDSFVVGCDNIPTWPI